MEYSDEELHRLLNDSGKIAILRKYVIAFLLKLEALKENAEIPESRACEEIDGMIRSIELNLNQLILYQQAADNLFLEMDREQRRVFYREAQDILRLFGWHDKINETGDMV